MLSAILVSVRMVLLSTLSVIRHLISGNNLNWVPNLQSDPLDVVDLGLD